MHWSFPWVFRTRGVRGDGGRASGGGLNQRLSVKLEKKTPCIWHTSGEHGFKKVFKNTRVSLITTATTTLGLTPRRRVGKSYMAIRFEKTALRGPSYKTDYCGHSNELTRI